MAAKMAAKMAAEITKMVQLLNPCFSVYFPLVGKYYKLSLNVN